MSLVENCPLCGNSDSWVHSLLECSASRCIWALADEQLVEAMSEIQEPSARQWIFHLHEVLSSSQFTEAVVTLWAIWFAWKKLIHEAINQTPLATLFLSKTI